MSQNARLALWVPTADPAAVNQGILLNDFPDAIKAMPTRFATPTGGSGGGGIEEAPVNGKPYARQNGGWVETPPTVIDGGTF